MKPVMGALAALCLLGSQLAAQDVLPDRRVVVTRDMDFYGGDLQPLFDTTLRACSSLCLNDAACGAFTFNAGKGACFPKSGVAQRTPFAGAMSGEVIATPPDRAAQAARRRDEIGFVREDLLAAAQEEAGAIGLRHPGGDWDVPELLAAARSAEAQGNIAAALDWTGSALAQEDSTGLWLTYARLSLAQADAPNRSDRYDLRRQAMAAAVNAYLRAGDVPQRSAALLDMARAFEAVDEGQLMIPALRLAQNIAPTPEAGALLEDALGKYGFRITGHEVDADSAAPRICAEFSDPLHRAGQDYAPYVRLPDDRLAVTSDDTRVCVTGLAHGMRYDLVFRAGLPSAEGETLQRDVPISAYVRDRAPKVTFPGRAYVLPKGPDAGLPVKTVNLSELDLTLRRVSERNLLRTMQDSYFGKPLSAWEEQQLSDGVAEEIWTGTGEVGNSLNADVTTRLPMGEVVGDLPAGVYALTASVPGDEDAARATQWFILSDIGLTTLEGADGLTVFARGLSDAGPLAGLEVTLLSRSNRPLGTVTTDAQGVSRFPAGLTRGTGGAEPALVTARRGEADMAFLSLTDPAFDLSDRGVAGRDPAGPIDAFLTTDRGAYRAGEVVHATALLRDAQVAAVEVPLTAVLTRPDGVEHARIVSSQGVAGGHVFDLPLAPSVPRGTWRLAVYADTGADPLASRTLLVEDFIPERIDVLLSLPDTPIRQDAPSRLTLEARYLFGAPAGDLTIEGELTLTPETTIEGVPNYSFGRHDAGTTPETRSFGAGLRTDAEGSAEITLPLPEGAPGQPQTARATVRVIDGSGRPVERSITRPVAPASAMIGIRPEFDGTIPEGSEAGFLLQAIGPDLAPVPMEVSWTLNRIDIRYQWYEMNGNWNWEPVTSRSTIASGQVGLGDAPRRVAADVDWGRHELVVGRTDGAYVASSVGFDAGWFAPASAQPTPDTLELTLDKPLYAPGDTAQLRIVPREAGQALVTVLSDRVISMQAVEVPAGETLIELPVTDEWGAGAYVTAQVIRPTDRAAGHAPGRSLGLAHAAIDPGARQLAVSLDAPEQSAPRGPLSAAVQVEGVPEGETAYVTVAAVDVGILNLTGFDSPAPSGYYFGQQRLGVEIRDIYGRLIDGSTGAMGQLRSGGDAGGAARRQAPPPTEELVAFFSGPVTVGPDGLAELSFDMPDFNGTVRLMAVAWTRSAVGEAEAEVLVRDPVVISTALPRFLAPGDETRLALELTHASGAAGAMALEVSGEGLGRGPREVMLDAGGKARISLPLVAGDPGDHEITVALTTPDGIRLTKRLMLGVRVNDPATGRTRRLTLAPGQTFTLDRETLAGLRLEGSEVIISAGPLARLDVAGMLSSLDRYPYGCTEQVTSQTLPLLYLSQLAEPLGIGSPAQLDRQIGQAIAKVLTRQSAGGGFGLWQAGDGNLWLDAYVTDFLTRARASGQEVPQMAMERALDNLRNRLAYAADFDDGGEEIAYALMVLAHEGKALVGDLRYYADERADAFATPLAQAQLGAALARYGDQPRADRMFAKAAAWLAAEAGPEAQVWRGDFGSRLRDAAGVLSLATEARSDAVDREALLTRITAATRPLSTQEQSWSLMAAHALVQDPAVQGLSVDGVQAGGPFLRRIPGDALTLMRLKNEGTMPLPITLTTLGQPEGGTEAGGYGYALDRAYFTMEGEPVTDAIRQGDRMVVVLTVRPAEDGGARLMIDDALPAGLEIDNPNLLRSGDLRGLPWLEPTDAVHAEFRAERFLAAVDQQGAAPIRLAYVVRAVTPGRFHHPAALVEDMYRPEYRATTSSGTMEIE
nr:alpha-2-macroglobulin family protein [Salipiger pallidus]